MRKRYYHQKIFLLGRLEFYVDTQSPVISQENFPNESAHRQCNMRIYEKRQYQTEREWYCLFVYDARACGICAAKGNDLTLRVMNWNQWFHEFSCYALHELNCLKSLCTAVQIMSEWQFMSFSSIYAALGNSLRAAWLAFSGELDTSAVKKGQQILWYFLSDFLLLRVLRRWVTCRARCLPYSMPCILSLHNCGTVARVFWLCF